MCDAVKTLESQTLDRSFASILSLVYIMFPFGLNRRQTPHFLIKKTHKKQAFNLSAIGNVSKTWIWVCWFINLFTRPLKHSHERLFSGVRAGFTGLGHGRKHWDSVVSARWGRKVRQGGALGEQGGVGSAPTSGELRKLPLESSLYYQFPIEHSWDDWQRQKVSPAFGRRWKSRRPFNCITEKKNTPHTRVLQTLRQTRLDSASEWRVPFMGKSPSRQSPDIDLLNTLHGQGDWQTWMGAFSIWFHSLCRPEVLNLVCWRFK